MTPLSASRVAQKNNSPLPWPDRQGRVLTRQNEAISSSLTGTDRSVSPTNDVKPTGRLPRAPPEWGSSVWSANGEPEIWSVLFLNHPVCPPRLRQSRPLALLLRPVSLAAPASVSQTSSATTPDVCSSPVSSKAALRWSSRLSNGPVAHPPSPRSAMSTTALACDPPVRLLRLCPTPTSAPTCSNPLHYRSAPSAPPAHQRRRWKVPAQTRQPERRSSRLQGEVLEQLQLHGEARVATRSRSRSLAPRAPQKATSWSSSSPRSPTPKRIPRRPSPPAPPQPASLEKSS
ncbi:hypothetical protein L596_013991 [Steinernema carpocapsae]|uniref:Uncharacterized protein n=1 Tax=Steinernema carpocapsae TaxID=34508 RepID=A0A4U5N9Y4_STECR|nr:hypothetical protein L596_013991 [Steinernema carpocapsae]